MTKLLGTACAFVFAFGLALPASADDVSKDVVEKINALLVSMECEMDEDDIEAEDDGYELDDVFCKDGQYDIDLDKDLNVTGKRKE